MADIADLEGFALKPGDFPLARARAVAYLHHRTNVDNVADSKLGRYDIAESLHEGTIEELMAFTETMAHVAIEALGAVVGGNPEVLLQVIRDLSGPKWDEFFGQLTDDINQQLQDRARERGEA